MRTNDAIRLKRAKEIFTLHTTGHITLSPESLYQLGMLFQHSPSTEDYLIAAELGTLSGERGYSEGAWLSAAAEDRYLFYTTGKQKWGTQFQKNSTDTWEQVPMLDDTESGITDDLRAQKVIPPRSRQLEVYLARTDI